MGTLAVDNIQHTDGSSAVTLNNAGITNLSAGTIGSGVTGYTGIKAFQQFRLTTGKNGITSESDVTANISELSGGLNSNITQSSGIFSFALTGIYWIMWNFNTSYDNQTRHAYAWINATTNNSSYSHVARGAIGRFDPGGADVHSSGNVNYLFDVTNISQCKIKFSCESEAACNFLGNANINYNYWTFLRIGDS